MPVAEVKPETVPEEPTTEATDAPAATVTDEEQPAETPLVGEETAPTEETPVESEDNEKVVGAAIEEPVEEVAEDGKKEVKEDGSALKTLTILVGMMLLLFGGFYVYQMKQQEEKRG